MTVIVRRYEVSRLSFSIVRMSSNKTYTRKYTLFSIISYTAILATFIIGLAINHSLHFGALMYVMGVEFFASIVFAVADILREGKNIRRKMESDTAGDLSMYNNYMLTGTFLLLIFSLLVPAIIFSRTLLMILGPLFLMLLFIFAVNFVCLGFNLRPIMDVLDSREEQPEADSKCEQGSAEDEFSAEERESIQSALDSWIAKGGFSNIGTSHGVTFRVWLSKIRIEEAKKILINNPDETIEFVAEACGFASRSYFQNLFKAETGFTPREWRLKMYDL